MMTPHEALTRLKANDYKAFIEDGVEYDSDGPMNSPREAWFPIAFKGDDIFYPSGEEITTDSHWINVEAL